MTITLEVTKREAGGKTVKKLRESGVVPAIMYGPKEDATPLSLDKVIVEKFFKHGSESGLVKLVGLDEEKDVLVQEVSFDPIKGGIIHVDFYAVERGKELTTEVSLEYVGEAPAVKLGGSLTKVLHEVEVTCRPSDIPQKFMVDVSTLVDFEATIKIKDLVIPT